MLSNVIQGTGELVKSNGEYYHGEFQNGLYSGSGTYELKSCKLKYVGSFRNGLFHGQGVMQNACGVY